jgi:PAS domain S-box-containing protein
VRTSTTTPQFAVLLVEPEPTSTTSLRSQFEELDAMVESLSTAADIAAARSVLSDEQIDCVVCLHDPPTIDGVEVLSALRQTAPDMPVLLATEADRAGDALELGAADFVRLTDGQLHQGIVANRIASVVSKNRERGTYEQIFERATDGIAVHDPDSGDVLEANPRLDELLGRRPDETDDLTVGDLVPDDEYTEADIRELIGRTADQPRTAEWHYRTGEEEFCLEFNLKRTTLGGVDRVLAFVRDITEQRAHDRVLRDAYQVATDAELSFEEQVERLLEIAGDFLGANYGTLSQIEGETYEFEVVRSPGDELQDGETIPLSTTSCERTVATEETLVVEDIPGEAPDLAVRAANEELGTACYLGAPVVVNGEVYGTFCFFDDEPREAFSEFQRRFVELLSQWVAYELEQREYREELDARRERIAETFERIDDAVFSVDADWRLQFANERAATVLRAVMGLDDVAELQGRFLWAEVPDAVEETARERYEHAMRTGEAISFERYSEQLETWFEVHTYPDEDGLSVYFEDVTERKGHERELEESRARYRTLTEDVLDTSENGTFILDSEFDVVWVNEATERYFGLDRDDVIGADKQELIETDIASLIDHPDRFVEILTATYEDNTYVEQFECHVPEGDGREERWLEHWSQPIESGLYEGGRIEHYTDITDRKRREQELEESEARYRTLVENFPNGAVAFVDSDLRYQAVGGTAFGRIDGAADDPVGYRVREALPEETADMLAPRYEAALEGEASTFEGDLGDWRYRFHVHPLYDDDGTIFGAMGMSQDITEAEERERVLDELLEVSRQFLRTSEPGDIAAQVVESAAAILGYDITVVRRHDPETATLPPMEISSGLVERVDEVPTYDVDSDLVGEAFRSGEPTVASELASDVEHEYGNIESAMVFPLGDYGTFGVGATTPDAFDDEDRALAELLATTATAAFDRARYEETLRQYRHVIEHVEGMVFLLDADGRFQLVTDPLVEQLGYGRQALEGVPFTELLATDTGGTDDTPAGPLSEALESGRHSFGTTAVTAAGEEVPLEVELSTLPTDIEADGIVGIARNVAEHRQSERELRAAERRLELALEETNTAVWEWNVETDAVAWDETQEELIGLEPGAFEGTFDAFVERIHPEDRDRVEAAIDRTLENDVPYLVDFRMRQVDGGTVWVAARGRLVTDEDGTRRLVGITQDISERKRHEERLEALNVASTRLWEAQDEQTIAETTIGIAEQVLSEPFVAMWSYDESADELVPLAAADDATTLATGADAAADIGPIPAGTTEMQVFREGDTTTLEDHQETAAPAHPERDLRTLLVAPLGDHGQLHVGTRAVEPFGESTRKLIDVIARDTEAALSRVARERELERSHDRLVRTEQLADVGGWELDLPAGTVRWTDGTRHIHEVPAEFDPDLESAIEFYHPDDQELVRRSVERCRERGESFEIEARLVTAEGHERWVETGGEMVTDDGTPVRLEGAIRDITNRKQREQQLTVLYRILRHNLRNDLNVVEGFSKQLRDAITRLEPSPALAGQEVDVLDNVLDQDAGPSAASDLPTAELRDVLEAVSRTPFDELREYADRLEDSTTELMSLGEKAHRLQGLITEQSGTGAPSRLEPAVEAALDTIHREHPDASVDRQSIETAAIDGGTEQLTVLLEELIENAVEHGTDGGSPVEIRTTAREDAVVLEVVDRGPGIPEHEREVIREGDEDALLHGSGIGLWIANWIATHLGGTLTIGDNDPSGTVARVLLPRADRTEVAAMGE